MGGSLVEAVSHLIFVDQPPATAEAIILLGGHNTMIDRVAELVAAGYASVVITTGGPNRFFDGRVEADVHAEELQAVVPGCDILRERESHNTLENLLYSLRIIRRGIIRVRRQRVIVVAKPIVTRRAQLTAARIFPPQIESIVCSGSDRRGVTATNWVTRAEWRTLVMSEVEKIGKYYIQGDLVLPPTENTPTVPEDR